MRPSLIFPALMALCLSACATAPSAPLPQPEATAQARIVPTWTVDQFQAVLQRTQRLHLAFDPSSLSEGERAAVDELLQAGRRMQRLYIDQLHPQGLAAAAALSQRMDETGAHDLFRMNNGPIATTLDNRREPFMNVAPEAPARNFYPAGATKETLDAYLATHPEQRDALMDDRSVVWAANAENVLRAIAALDAHPALDTLHPGLRARLVASEGGLLAIPYSVAYAEDIFFIHDRLIAAAGHVEASDAAFARFLRLRARDLISDDYEGGDAAWVTGDFTGNLNAEIGAYETYDDSIYGVKASFGFSLLQRDVARSNELRAALRDIQVVENALPYGAHKEVRTNIPVGVYNIIADFGQARGTNTATILPNEAYLTRQYGRTILMRGNILLNPQLFEGNELAFNAAVADAHHGELTPDGMFNRTLWHEIGHYLGVDQTADGRDLDVALQDTADLMEEMKADLVSLTAARILRQRGVFSAERLRGIYASGVRRVLQKNRPRRDPPYGTMQLIQWNWFLDKGVLRFADGRLHINYARYPAAVEGLLREVLAMQRAGDRDAANAIVERWTTWRPDLHEVIAERMRASERTRFALVTYEALGDPAPNNPR
ncbi:MAG: hypothetical protein JNJ73_17235 [Hyphomonadaceae bacterium]|nr:hypothetical protein [Hyphomonadaceae bacterium]